MNANALINVNPVDKNPNNNPNNNPNLNAQFEMRDVEESIIAQFKKLKADGASYVFLVMFILDKVGIAKATETIKAIAHIENLLQKIMGDLADFSQLLKALLNQIDLSQFCGDKGSKTDPINGKGGSKDQIQKWLGEGHNGPNGNMTNGQYLIYLFKDLFGKNGKGGLLAQYKKALANPWYKQKPGSVVSGLNKLYGGSDGFTGTNWTSGSTTFLDYLTGKVPYDPNGMAGSMANAFADSWFNRTGEKPKSDPDKSYSDIVGEATNNIDGTKGVANGVNTQDSSELSMQDQNLESLDKTGQTVITNYSQFTQAAANNQKGQ